MFLAVTDYRPRAPEQGVLQTIVRTHLEPFLREAADCTDGPGLPRFVEDEFRAFLACGAVAHGCARLRCEGCGLDRLLAFSCKGRGFCPSCGGRRMTERAARLVDTVLPRVPVRQWVLSLPHWLRYGLAWDHPLCCAVLAASVRTLLAFQRRQGARCGFPGGQAGSVTVIQRFGGALNMNVHFHTLVLAGVFTTDAGGAVHFHATPPPTDENVAELLRTIRRRILRLLARRGMDSDADVAPPDPLAETSPALAGLSRASVPGRVALGRRAGARLLALGRDPDALWAIAGGRRHAHLDGFDLHANVAVRGSRPRSAGAALPVPPAAGGGARAAAPDGGRAHRPDPQGCVGRWDDAPRLRAAGAVGAARGADAATPDQPDRLPRGAGSPRARPGSGGGLWRAGDDRRAGAV